MRGIWPNSHLGPGQEGLGFRVSVAKESPKLIGLTLGTAPTQ